MRDYSSTAGPASAAQEYAEPPVSSIRFFQTVAEDPIVVLVDESDREIGTAGKRAAHKNGGMLHRAFSIFLFDPEGRVLLQKRAAAKYHFGGLWTNACCGHAAPGEDLALTAAVRLWQEMGICTQIAEVGVFVYRATDLKSGLTEHEIDHVFVGITSDAPEPDPAEADGWEWASPAAIAERLAARPEGFTPWFRAALTLALAAEKR